MTLNKELKKLRIGILGIRGIPANYGGFETFAEELAPRLAKRCHHVTVYGRANFIKTKEKVYRGVHLVVLPTIAHKYLDTPVHAFLATLHALFRRYDVLLYCNSANSFCTFLPRLTGKRVILNVDGLEWKRSKWSSFGKWVYKFSEWLATLLPNHVVTDARDVQDYYERKFHQSSTYIPYGAVTGKVKTDEALKRFGVRRNKYVLYVSRLEPENNAHVVVSAFEKVKTDLKLVVVGDAPYSHEYIQRLRSTKDPRIIFTGYIFGSGYREFQSHALCYVQATEVGGTHPALVEAMGHANCILANDVPEHREVLGEAGRYFHAKDEETLTSLLEHMLKNPDEIQAYQKLAYERVLRKYSWESVTTAYEHLFYRALRLAP
jgi:glycosyltransferase involved in cell wall biosynthesis